MEANKKRFIRVAGELIEVTKEVYLTYYRGKRREKAQHEKEQFHHVVSFDALDTEGLQGVQMIVNTASPEPEDIVIEKIMCEKLHACMAKLSEDEPDAAALVGRKPYSNGQRGLDMVLYLD